MKTVVDDPVEVTQHARHIISQDIHLARLHAARHVSFSRGSRL